MREEFANDIESTCKHPTLMIFPHPLSEGIWLTPHSTQDKLHRGIRLVVQIQTDGDRTLRHQDRSDVMHRAYRTDLHPVYQLEDVHAHQYLRADDQDIAQRHDAALCIRRAQRRGAEGHVDEGIDCHHQDQSLGQAGYVVVDEAAPLGFVEAGVSGFVETAHEEPFEDELFDEEEEDEHDREYQHGEGG